MYAIRSYYEHYLDGLGQDDVAHGPGVGESLGIGRLELSPGDGPDACPHDLRDVGPRIDRKGRA